jgi:hypothetical protein
MSIDNTFSAFKTKYSLPDSAIDELKTIFDSIIVDFAHKILNDEKTVPKLNTSKASTTKLTTTTKLDTSVVKKFATKIAEEYASECGITLEEIPCETGKVTKKEIEKYIKNKSGSKSSETSGKKLVKENSDEDSKIISKKEKCGGVNKDGNPCSANATKTPDGSKKCYCFRHAIDWKQYEISSDSDNDLEEEDEIIHTDLAIVTEE